MLLAIPGDNTYPNYQEATRAFWRQTVLPLAARISSALSQWLAAPHGLTLKFDLDQVDALTSEREALWTRLESATFLTPNEKRAAAGFDSLPEGGDGLIAKFNPHHDALGRFTSGPGGENDDFDPNFHLASRRRTQNGTPAQQARLGAAQNRANRAERQVREVAPNWRPPASASSANIEGDIAAAEGRALAAEARLSELMQGAIPGTNPAWGPTACVTSFTPEVIG